MGPLWGLGKSSHIGEDEGCCLFSFRRGVLSGLGGRGCGSRHAEQDVTRNRRWPTLFPPKAHSKTGGLVAADDLLKAQVPRTACSLACES